MIGIMDLNAPPLPEDDDDTFEQHFEGYSASEKHNEHVNHAEHVESAVDILRRVHYSLLPESFWLIVPVLYVLCCGSILQIGYY